jgi:hypothetical protein
LLKIETGPNFPAALPISSQHASHVGQLSCTAVELLNAKDVYEKDASVASVVPLQLRALGCLYAPGLTLSHLQHVLIAVLHISNALVVQSALNVREEARVVAIFRATGVSGRTSYLLVRDIL